MAYQLSDASITHTLYDYIEFNGSDETSYGNFAIKRKENIYYKQEKETKERKQEYAIFYETNILDYYLDQLKAICLKVDTFTNEEKITYRYHPDRLSYYLYGTVQLDYIILLVNGIIDPKEFDFKRGYIYVPKAIELREFLSRVKNSETRWLTESYQDE